MNLRELTPFLPFASVLGDKVPLIKITRFFKRIITAKVEMLYYTLPHATPHGSQRPAAFPPLQVPSWLEGKRSP